MAIHTNTSIHVTEELYLHLSISPITVENATSHALQFGLGEGAVVFMSEHQIDQLEQVIKAYKANNYRGKVNNRVKTETE